MNKQLPINWNINSNITKCLNCRKNLEQVLAAWNVIAIFLCVLLLLLLLFANKQQQQQQSSKKKQRKNQLKINIKSISKCLILIYNANEPSRKGIVV